MKNLVGIGGSAGGLKALLEFLEHYDPAADASVFVVLHQGEGPNQLGEILQRVSPIEVCCPEDGDAIRPNCLYLAPNDMHMMIGSGHIHLRRGPRENNFRPAIDPLFRSLAIYGASHAIAVVLSGLLDDGAAGVRAVAQTGGTVLVQDPETAWAGDMPQAAINTEIEVHTVASPAELARQVSSLVAQPAGPSHDPDPSIAMELAIAGLQGASIAREEQMGELSPYNCPDCNGVLWRIEDGPLSRFRCHTGHAYTHSALSLRQEEKLEQLMFGTLRAHRERAEILLSMADKTEGLAAERLRARARGCEEDAAALEQMILTRRDNTQAA